MYRAAGYSPLTEDHLAELALEVRAVAMREREPAVIDALRELAAKLEMPLASALPGASHRGRLLH